MIVITRKSNRHYSIEVPKEDGEGTVTIEYENASQPLGVVVGLLSKNHNVLVREDNNNVQRAAKALRKAKARIRQHF